MMRDAVPLEYTVFLHLEKLFRHYLFVLLKLPTLQR